MKTIILDFDGTIADTKQSILLTIQETLKILQIKNKEEIRKYLGLPIKEIFNKISGLEGKELEEAIKIYRDNYLAISYHTVQLFPDVKEILTYLYKKEIFLAIASNKGKAALENLLNYLDIRSLIQIVLGEEDVLNKKPAPDMVLSIIEKTRLKREDILVVGDTIYDIRMGKSAACKTCGVTYGNSLPEELREESPDYIINKFSEIINLDCLH